MIDDVSVAPYDDAAIYQSESDVQKRQGGIVIFAVLQWYLAREHMLALAEKEPFKPLKPSARRELWAAYLEENRCRKELLAAIGELRTPGDAK